MHRSEESLLGQSGQEAEQEGRVIRGEVREHATPTTRTLFHCFIFTFSYSSAPCFGHSDGENVPESVPVVRSSRRAKTATLEKTKLDLNTRLNQEANVS